MDIDMATIAATAAAIISAIAFFKNIRDRRFQEIYHRFDDIKEILKRHEDRFDDLHEEIKDVKDDLSEIKQRLTFVETSICFLDVTPADPNIKVNAAKKAWATRRARQLDKKMD